MRARRARLDFGAAERLGFLLFGGGNPARLLSPALAAFKKHATLALTRQAGSEPIKGSAVPSQLSAIKAKLAASPAKAGSRFAIILTWAREGLDDAIDAVGVDSIIKEAQLLYDSYVAPIDIPWVPDIAEPMLIDAPAKQLLAAIIRGFHDLIHAE
jgi:hypothetical protein